MQSCAWWLGELWNLTDTEIIIVVVQPMEEEARGGGVGQP